METKSLNNIFLAIYTSVYKYQNPSKFSHSLSQLENTDWGEPTYSSYLVRTCHALRKKPLQDFTIEDLRIMIGQNISLECLMPLAIPALVENILAEGDFYPGDLLDQCFQPKAVFGKNIRTCMGRWRHFSTRMLPLSRQA